MNSVIRNSMLYKTAAEFGDYAMNHASGCSHGCLYPCYAMLTAMRYGRIRSHDEWNAPELVSNTLELLEAEIPRLRAKIKSVQLCFMTDPFMLGFPEIQEMSLASVKKLNDSGIKCVILTKGLLPASLAGRLPENEYGITLVSLSEQFRKRFEPGAAPLSDRLAALKALHDRGSRTWVSMEPYPTPNVIQQDLGEILEAVSFADRIMFGRMNYNKITSEYPKHREFYNEQAGTVSKFCRERGIRLSVKSKTVTRKKAPAP